MGHSFGSSPGVHWPLRHWQVLPASSGICPPYGRRVNRMAALLKSEARYFRLNRREEPAIKVRWID